VPVVVSCPNCEKRLAVKDELKGRALVCPQCKSRFSVPTDDAPKNDLLNVKEDSPATGGGMDFLHSLGPSSVGAAKGNGQTSAPDYSAQRPASSRPAVSSSATARAGRVKKQAEQMKMIYVGGGVAAALLIVVVAFAMFGQGNGGGGAGGKKKDENIRFNLTEIQRRQLFSEMLHAVDVNGQTKTCRDIWRRLGAELKLNDSQISEVLKEGLDSDWEQPALEVTQDQKNKTNRRDWIRVINQTGRDPIMAL
jgi:hypothetical protein